MRFLYLFSAYAAAISPEDCLPAEFDVLIDDAKVRVYLSTDRRGALTSDRRFVIEYASEPLLKHRAFHDSIDSSDDASVFGHVRPIADEKVSLWCQRNVLVVEQVPVSPFNAVKEIISRGCPQLSDTYILSDYGRSASTSSGDVVLLIEGLQGRTAQEFFTSLAFYETAKLFPEITEYVGILVDQKVDGFCSSQMFSVALAGPFTRMSHLTNVEDIVRAAILTVKALDALHRNFVVKNKISLDDVLVINSPTGAIERIQLSDFSASVSISSHESLESAEEIKRFVDIVADRLEEIDPVYAEILKSVKSGESRDVVASLNQVLLASRATQYRPLNERFGALVSSWEEKFAKGGFFGRCPSQELSFVGVSGPCPYDGGEGFYVCSNGLRVKGNFWGLEKIDNIKLVRLKSIIELSRAERLEDSIGKFFDVEETDPCHLRMVSYEPVDDWIPLPSLKLRTGAAKEEIAKALRISANVVKLIANVHGKGFVATNLRGNMIIVTDEDVRISPVWLHDADLKPLSALGLAIQEEINLLNIVANAFRDIFSEIPNRVVESFLADVERIRQDSSIRPPYMAWAEAFLEAGTT